MSVQVKLLGAVQLLRNGQVAPLRAVKCLALLTALALNSNNPVSLDSLVNSVWGDDPPRSAVANLRNYAGSVRRLVDGRMSTVGGGYQLTLQAGERDVDDFRDLADQGRAALAAGNPVAAVAALTESLALWRGPAGQGLPTGTALDVDLICLDEERLAAFDTLADARLHLDDHAALVPDLLKHLYHHPLRERSWAQLMLAQYRAGSAAAALATYADAREVIGSQLGIEPDPLLSELHQAILNRSPNLLAESTERLLGRFGTPSRPHAPPLER